MTLFDKFKRIPAGLYRNALQGFRKVKALIPIYGVIGTLKIVVKNILWVEVMYRFEKNVSNEKLTVTPKIPLTITVYSSRDEVHQIKGWQEIFKIRGEYGLEQFNKRLGRGDLCFAAYTDEQFTGYLWIEFPPAISEAGYKLAANECYQFDGWTFKKYRGNRVIPFIVQEVNKYLRENRSDINNIVSHVAVWNNSSLAVGQRMEHKITRRELSIIFLGYHTRLRLKGGIPNQ